MSSQIIDNPCMSQFARSSARASSAAGSVRKRIEHGGERLWRVADFRDLPFAAAAQALSRLTRRGMLDRLSKGIYYRSRETTFGKSRPNPALMQTLAANRAKIHPSGIAAGNLLGFTTQTAVRHEVSTSALSLPRKLISSDTIIHTRRPEAWADLSESDAALLDFLRQRGKSSELSPDDTVRRALALASEEGRFGRLLKVACSEPPRVRAMLGAIGQQLGKRPVVLRRLRESLNPFSRFDFGMLARLRYAREWQASGPPFLVECSNSNIRKEAKYCAPASIKCSNGLKIVRGVACHGEAPRSTNQRTS